MKNKYFIEYDDYNDYGNLAWYCVLANDFEGAIWAGEKYMELGGKNIVLISNLALGYLFNGDLEKAKQIYIKHKNLKSWDGRMGVDIFINDIITVQLYGVKPKNEKDNDKIMEIFNTY